MSTLKTVLTAAVVGAAAFVIVKSFAPTLRSDISTRYTNLQEDHIRHDDAIDRGKVSTYEFDTEYDFYGRTISS